MSPLATSGEVSVTLDGVEYPLRPSQAACEAIEAKLGRSLFEIADAAQRLALTGREAGIVTAEMMQAWGRANPDAEHASSASRAGVEKVARLIFDAGLLKILPRLAILLMAAVTGGVTIEGELKPGAVKSQPAPGGD